MQKRRNRGEEAKASERNKSEGKRAIVTVTEQANRVQDQILLRSYE